MSQPNEQTQQASRQRDMMFCHECNDEWYRDEHGLTCPECGSDFTEIIEPEHDPRADHILHQGDGDETDSMPGLEEGPPHIHGLHALHHHHPWREEPDPDAGDISNLRFRQTGPGTFAITGTIYRTVSPAGQHVQQVHVQNPLMTSFATMLHHIVGRGGGTAPTDGQPGGGQPGEAQTAGGHALTGEAGEGQRAEGAGTGSGTTAGGHRFTYTSSARLSPRNSNGGGPHVEPVDNLEHMLHGLMHVLAEAPPPVHVEQGGRPGVPPFNPFAAIFGHMMPGTAAPGDFVYSQEALDRIISELMERNATGSAPGPAAQEDIDKLPEKIVDEGMLDEEGKAECTICMDEVNIGAKVTALPCKHWFHRDCIVMWLKEHDTCPHCRQSISPKHSEPSNGPDTQGAHQSAPTGQMPGAFFGEGAGEHGTHMSGAVPASSGGESAGESGGESLGERIRRGLFGAPR